MQNIFLFFCTTPLKCRKIRRSSNSFTYMHVYPKVDKLSKAQRKERERPMTFKSVSYKFPFLSKVLKTREIRFHLKFTKEFLNNFVAIFVMLKPKLKQHNRVVTFNENVCHTF